MNFNRGLFFVLIFLSVITIISLWSLYIYRLAPLIIIIAVVVSFFVLKKFYLELPKISSAAILLALLVAFLAAFPYLLVTPFVDASADPAAHISALAIGENIPSTYAPFSDLEYRYQIGFPLLAKAFIDLFPFVSSNAIVWFFGVLFAFLSAVLIYLLARDIFGGEKYGLIALALFVGSKIVFQNMYWGQYTFLFASVFFLASFLAFYKKSNLAYFFFPIIFVAHPGVAFYSLIFFGFWAVVHKNFAETAKLFASGLLVAPAFFVSYIPFLTNLGAEETVPFTILHAVNAMSTFPLWIGGIIFIGAIYSIWRIISKRDYSKINAVLVGSFIFSSLLFIFLSATGRILGGRVIELSMFSGLLLSVGSVKTFLGKKPAIFRPLLVILLIVSLGLFFTSGQLEHLRNGSKINPEQKEFADAFKDFDPEYKRTLFLIENHAKIAEVSQKIPVDVLSGWYLSYDKRIAGDDPYYPEAERIHGLVKKVTDENCSECLFELQKLGFSYLVACDGNMAGLLGMHQVFSYNGHMVFAYSD